MNQWFGPIVEEEFLRPSSWRRFALTGPLSALTIFAMLLGTRFLKPTLPAPPPRNAVEATLVELVPPQPAGLQGGAAPAPVKPVEKPKPPRHTKMAAIPRPKVEPPPLSNPSETGEVAAPGAPATPGGPSKEETVGIPGGTGVGSGAGIGGDASGARALYAPTPTIPDELRENVFQAEAVAHFRVAPDGTVEVSLVRPTPNPRLNQIVLDALRKWKFFPAMKDGIAIASEFDVRIPITVQ